MTFFFLFLVFVGVIFPSDGSHALYNPKSIAFALMSAAFIANLVQKKRFTPIDQGLMLFTLAILGFIFFFAWVGLENRGDMLGQVKLFLITASLPIGLAYLMEKGDLSFSTFMKTAVFTNMFYSLIKLSLVALHLLGVIDLISLLEKMGLRYMSMEVFGKLGRMQTSVDILTPFLLYFVLSSEQWGVKLSKTFVRFYIVIAWLSILLSFSRYFMMCGLMAHFMCWIGKKEGPFIASLVKFFLAALLIVGVAGPERIYKVVEKRFLSEESSASDRVREIQIREMTDKFQENPLLGLGMGGHTQGNIRDDKIKFSYEVQWMAFLMQFGMVGILFLVTLLAYLGYLILSPPTLSRLGLFTIYLLWLLSGFTNPFLISLPSGIIYAFFLGTSRVKPVI